MIKSETKVFSCNIGGNGLSTMTSEINKYLKDNENIEISYHNITTNNEGYVIATVKAIVEKAKENTDVRDNIQAQAQGNK